MEEEAGVAPLVGAWIEISLYALHSDSAMSLPLWERGLKSLNNFLFLLRFQVAPLVGAWIEIKGSAQIS